jgi:hypothetical protein
MLGKKGIDGFPVFLVVTGGHEASWLVENEVNLGGTTDLGTVDLNAVCAKPDGLFGVADVFPV